MSETFKYHEFNDEQKDASLFLRLGAERLEAEFDDRIPDSREKSLAKTNLEQAVMWANKAIALHGIKE